MNLESFINKHRVEETRRELFMFSNFDIALFRVYKDYFEIDFNYKRLGPALKRFKANNNESFFKKMSLLFGVKTRNIVVSELNTHNPESVKDTIKLYLDNIGNLDPWVALMFMLDGSNALYLTFKPKLLIHDAIYSEHIECLFIQMCDKEKPIGNIKLLNASFDKKICLFFFVLHYYNKLPNANKTIYSSRFQCNIKNHQLDMWQSFPQFKLSDLDNISESIIDYYNNCFVYNKKFSNNKRWQSLCFFPHFDTAKSQPTIIQRIGTHFTIKNTGSDLYLSNKIYKVGEEFFIYYATRENNIEMVFDKLVFRLVPYVTRLKLNHQLRQVQIRFENHERKTLVLNGDQVTLPYSWTFKFIEGQNEIDNIEHVRKAQPVTNMKPTLELYEVTIFTFHIKIRKIWSFEPYCGFDQPLANELRVFENVDYKDVLKSLNYEPLDICDKQDRYYVFKEYLELPVSCVKNSKSIFEAFLNASLALYFDKYVTSQSNPLLSILNNIDYKSKIINIKPNILQKNLDEMIAHVASSQYFEPLRLFNARVYIKNGEIVNKGHVLNLFDLTNEYFYTNTTKYDLKKVQQELLNMSFVDLGYEYTTNLYQQVSYMYQYHVESDYLTKRRMFNSLCFLSYKYQTQVFKLKKFFTTFKLKNIYDQIDSFYDSKEINFKITSSNANNVNRKNISETYKNLLPKYFYDIIDLSNKQHLPFISEYLWQTYNYDQCNLGCMLLQLELDYSEIDENRNVELLLQIYCSQRYTSPEVYDIRYDVTRNNKSYIPLQLEVNEKIENKDFYVLKGINDFLQKNLNRIPEDKNKILEFYRTKRTENSVNVNFDYYKQDIKAIESSRPTKDKSHLLRMINLSKPKENYRKQDLVQQTVLTHGKNLLFIPFASEKIKYNMIIGGICLFKLVFEFILKQDKVVVETVIAAIPPQIDQKEKYLIPKITKTTKICFSLYPFDHTFKINFKSNNDTLFSIESFYHDLSVNILKEGKVENYEFYSGKFKIRSRLYVYLFEIKPFVKSECLFNIEITEIDLSNDVEKVTCATHKLYPGFKKQNLDIFLSVDHVLFEAKNVQLGYFFVTEKDVLKPTHNVLYKCESSDPCSTCKRLST